MMRYALVYMALGLGVGGVFAWLALRYEDLDGSVAADVVMFCSMCALLWPWILYCAWRDRQRERRQRDA